MTGYEADETVIEDVDKTSTTWNTAGQCHWDRFRWWCWLVEVDVDAGEWDKVVAGYEDFFRVIDLEDDFDGEDDTDEEGDSDQDDWWGRWLGRMTDGEDDSPKENNSKKMTLVKNVKRLTLANDKDDGWELQTQLTFT